MHIACIRSSVNIVAVPEVEPGAVPYALFANAAFRILRPEFFAFHFSGIDVGNSGNAKMPNCFKFLGHICL